jgi:hypothetical protein
MAQHGFEELRRHIRIQQPVAVLRERRVIPDRIVNAEPDEPAEQQVVIDLLHQLAFAAHRIERLQERGPEQPFRRDRLSAGALVKTLELDIQRDEHVIDDALDHTERMLRRHPTFEVDIGKKRSRTGIRSAHVSPSTWRENGIIFARACQ